MGHSRRLAAFISGLMLYSVAMLISGALAELHLPREYFKVFGPEGSHAQLLGEACVYALPIFLLTLGWSYFVLRPLRRGSRPTTAWCLGGLGLAWLGWLFYGVVRLSEAPVPGDDSVAVMLLSSLEPPLWGALNGLAALCGVLIAGALAGRQAQTLLLPARG